MKTPSRMRAVEISKPGGPEVLKVTERPVPQPRPAEVLIKVAAAGVNRPDVLQRMGTYPVPPDASDLPGLEVAAGSDEKCAACVRLGAEKAINYKTQDFAAEIKAATGGKGVDVILDMVGGDYVPKELECLADEGRLVFIAFLRGPKTELDISQVMRRRLVISGSTLRPRSTEFKGYLAKNLREQNWPHIESG